MCDCALHSSIESPIKLAAFSFGRASRTSDGSCKAISHWPQAVVIGRPTYKEDDTRSSSLWYRRGLGKEDRPRLCLFRPANLAGRYLQLREGVAAPELL